MEYLKELVDVEDVKKLASIYDFDDKDDDDFDEEDVWGENREDCDTRGIEWLDGVCPFIQGAYCKRFWAYVWRDDKDDFLHYEDCAIGDGWKLELETEDENSVLQEMEWLMEKSVRDDCDYLYQHTNSPYKTQSRW